MFQGNASAGIWPANEWGQIQEGMKVRKLGVRLLSSGEDIQDLVPPDAETGRLLWCTSTHRSPPSVNI